jgi:hypothetical protein
MPANRQWLVTIHNADAHAAFHSEIEGESEVNDDSGDTERVALLEQLLALSPGVESTPYPVSFLLPSELVAIASEVVGNMLNSFDEEEFAAGSVRVAPQ